MKPQSLLFALLITRMSLGGTRDTHAASLERQMLIALYYHDGLSGKGEYTAKGNMPVLEAGLNTLSKQPKSTPINNDTLVGQMRQLQHQGIRNIEYYPDNSSANHPDIPVIHRVFSLQTPFTP